MTKLKNVFIPIFVSIAFLAQAQNGDFRNVVSANIGLNVFGSAAGSLDGNTNTNEAQYKYGKFTAGPTFQLAWDYGVVKWFSIGVAGSYNRAKYAYEDVQYKGEKLGTVNFVAGRTTLSIRPLFHYGNANNWDFYSGFRLGAGFWSAKLSLDANDDLAMQLVAKIDEDLAGYVPGFIRKRLVNDVGARAGFVAPVVQFVPIGVRGYFNDHIGLNAELAVGSPYFLTGGVNYRF